MSGGIGDHSSVVGLYTTTVGTIHMRMFNWTPDEVIRGGRGSSVGKGRKSDVES
jgi:hypothetical protein